MGWTPVRRRGQPATCLPAPASPPSLGAPTSPGAESQLWSWSKGPGQRVLLGRGRSKHRKPEKPDKTRPSGRKRLFWEELPFLRRGREETLEKQRRVDRRRTALTKEPRGRKPANAEKRLFAGAGTGTPTHRQGSAPQKHKPGARKSWICPHPAPRHWPPSRRSRPTRCGPPRKTHTLGPWFTTLIEYPNYSVQIENTVFSYKCIVK